MNLTKNTEIKNYQLETVLIKKITTEFPEIKEQMLKIKNTPLHICSFLYCFLGDIGNPINNDKNEKALKYQDLVIDFMENEYLMN